MNTLEDLLRRNVIVNLVQRNITCPVTGEVLDVRTCVVLLDNDGDPRAVLSQEGWREVLAQVGEKHAAQRGLFIDSETERS